MIIAFYDQLEHADNYKEGLNQTEFEYLKYALDENVRDHFPEFEEFDQDQNGFVPYREYEKKLNEVYRDRIYVISSENGWDVPHHITEALQNIMWK